MLVVNFYGFLFVTRIFLPYYIVTVVYFCVVSLVLINLVFLQGIYPCIYLLHQQQ